MDPITKEVSSEIPQGVPASIPDPNTPELPRPMRCKNRFTIFVVDGSSYPVTSDAKNAVELHSRMFLPGEILEKMKLDPILAREFETDGEETRCYYFAESVVQANGPSEVEGIREGWDQEDEWDQNDEDEGRRRPKWAKPR